MIQVRDKVMNLYYEALVIELNPESGTVDVRYGTGASNDEEVEEETGIPLSRVRLVHTWDFIEVGDTVKVKEGALFFEGKVVNVNDFNDTVVVDMGEDEEDGSRLLETHHRNAVTKVYSGRLPREMFKSAINKVLQQIRGSRAFGSVFESKMKESMKVQDGEEES